MKLDNLSQLLMQMEEEKLELAEENFSLKDMLKDISVEPSK
jgi:hypothetical protein